MAVAPTPSGPFYTRPVDYAKGERMLGAALAAEADARPGWEPLDGETHRLGGRPADFGRPAGATALPASFRRWHTVHQLEWVKDHVKAKGAGDNHTADIPGGGRVSTRALSLPLAGSGETLHVVLTDGQRAVAVLNDMTARQLRGLTPVDQHLVAAHEGFAATVGRLTGLRPSAADFPPPSGDAAADARAAVATARAAIRAPIVAIRDAISVREASATTALPGVGKQLKPGTLVRDALDAMIGRIDRMAVFDEVAISTAVAALEARDTRLARYGEVYRATRSPTTTPFGEATMRSVDGDAGLRGGYELLVAGEARLKFLIEATAKVTSAPVPGTPVRALDAGGLVYAFQLYENHEREVEAEAETEEVRQRNELLRAYAEFQKLINASSAAIPPPPASSEGVVNPNQGVLTTGMDANGRPIALTPAEQRVAAMFDARSALTVQELTPPAPVVDIRETPEVPGVPAVGPLPARPAVAATTTTTTTVTIGKTIATTVTTSVKTHAVGTTPESTTRSATTTHAPLPATHPVEAALGLSRPVAELLDGAGEPTLKRTKAQWDLLSASVAAAVRVLDRDVQARSNQVNATSRERTRHFDLATDTLNRMSGMVQTIGRGIN